MAAAPEIPWAHVAAIAGGVLALAVVLRGLVAVSRVALGEVRYRASDPDKWLKWIKVT